MASVRVSFRFGLFMPATTRIAFFGPLSLLPGLGDLLFRMSLLFEFDMMFLPRIMTSASYFSLDLRVAAALSYWR